jgi:hypothetical protein
MDNRTFNELLNAGEVGLIMADGAQALSKKQLGTIIQRTQSSIGRNIPESFQSKVQSTTNLKPETRKENPFISPIGQTRNTRLRKGDSVAAILAKMFSFMKKTHEEKKLRRELIRDFEKEKEDKKNRLEKKTFTKKPKSESKLKNFAKALASSFKNALKNIISFLGKVAIAAFIFQTQKTVEEVAEDAAKFYKKIVEVTESIKKGIQQIKDWVDKLSGWYQTLKEWLMSLEFFGWKPFGGTERPISTFPEGTTEYEKYKEITAVREGGPLGYDAMFGEFNKKNPPKYKGKMVSELTIGEAIEFGRSRGARGALGRYGFIPSTLESNYRDAGLSKDDIFNPTNQDIIFKTLTDKNANDLTKRLGRPPTAAELRVAHAVGVGGSMQLYKAEKEDSQQTALDILLPQLDKSTAGKKKYDKRENERESNQHLKHPAREVLDKMRKDFIEKNNPNLIKPENSLSGNESMLTSPVVKPSINSDKVSSLSEDNKNLKKDVKPIIVADVSTTNNMIGGGQQSQVLTFPTLLDYPHLPSFMST